MEMEVKIKVQISEDVEVTLTEEEARALYSRLKQLFGDNNIYTIPYNPNPYPDWTWPKITYFHDNQPLTTNEYNTGKGAEVPPPRSISANDILTGQYASSSRPDDLH